MMYNRIVERVNLKIKYLFFYKVELRNLPLELEFERTQVLLKTLFKEKYQN